MDVGSENEAMSLASQIETNTARGSNTHGMVGGLLRWLVTKVCSLLSPGSVTTNLLADGSVTGGKLGDDVTDFLDGLSTRMEGVEKFGGVYCFDEVVSPDAFESLTEAGVYYVLGDEEFVRVTRRGSVRENVRLEVPVDGDHVYYGRRPGTFYVYVDGSLVEVPALGALSSLVDGYVRYGNRIMAARLVAWADLPRVSKESDSEVDWVAFIRELSDGDVVGLLQRVHGVESWSFRVLEAGVLVNIDEFLREGTEVVVREDVDDGSVGWGLYVLHGMRRVQGGTPVVSRVLIPLGGSPVLGEDGFSS